MSLNDLPARLDNAREDIQEAIRAYMTDMGHLEIQSIGAYVLGMNDHRVKLHRALLSEGEDS